MSGDEVRRKAERVICRLNGRLDVLCFLCYITTFEIVAYIMTNFKITVNYYL
jgi:hypothetical protein